jgi:hypothetical protein
MLGHRELTMEDYADILRRRIWLILGSAILCLVAGVAVSHIIPPQFQSQTLILIEQQKVPEDYVKPVVEEDLGSRLASMREQILSRSRIEPLIKRFNLFAEGNASMDSRIAMTQKAIGIKPIPSGQSGGMPGFYISFKAQDARTAQQVCGEITSLFVSENLSAREESALGTNEFLKQQLDDSKKNLDQQDAKLAAFQQKYFGRLPEQEQSNSNTLQALTTQLDAATQAVNRQQQNVTFLQAMVSQQAHDLQSAEPIANAALVDERKTELRALIKSRHSRRNTRPITPMWLRLRGKSPICRRRLRAPPPSRQRLRWRPRSTTPIRRSFSSSKLSIALLSKPWRTQSGIRRGLCNKCADMRRGSRPVRRSNRNTSKSLATTKQLWSSTTLC